MYGFVNTSCPERASGGARSIFMNVKCVVFFDHGYEFCIIHAGVWFIAPPVN